MPILKQHKDDSEIILELNISDENIVYDSYTDEFLIWIPYQFKLQVLNRYFSLDSYKPSFNLLGLKHFLSTLNALIKEREDCTHYDDQKQMYISTVSEQDIVKKSDEYLHFECGGMENEFTLKLYNIEDYYDDVLVNVELWLNMACVDEESGSYSMGFEFLVAYDDLIAFYEDLQSQMRKRFLKDIEEWLFISKEKSNYQKAIQLLSIPSKDLKEEALRYDYLKYVYYRLKEDDYVEKTAEYGRLANASFEKYLDGQSILNHELLEEQIIAMEDVTGEIGKCDITFEVLMGKQEVRTRICYKAKENIRHESFLSELDLWLQDNIMDKGPCEQRFYYSKILNELSEGVKKSISRDQYGEISSHVMQTR